MIMLKRSIIADFNTVIIMCTLLIVYNSFLLQSWIGDFSDLAGLTGHMTERKLKMADGQMKTPTARWNDIEP